MSKLAGTQADPQKRSRVIHSVSNKIEGGESLNNKKREDYNLTASIHTLAVKSEGIIDDIDEAVAKCIRASSRVKSNRSSTSIINPNKLTGELFKYSEFETALETILAGAGIVDYKIVRADLRLDSYDEEHYREYAKLNRYLISSLAVTYTVKNCYCTTDLFSQEQLSVAIKNKYFECENYDKKAESRGLDMAASRFEERSKAMMNNDLYREFTERWFERWDKAIQNLEQVQVRYNDELVRIWNENEEAEQKRFITITEFLLRYQDCIFTRRQMVELLSRLPGIRNPENTAKYIKQKYKIEFFSQADVRYAIGEIKRATMEFFDN